MGCTVPQDAYTTSKGGMLALTKSLAVQYGPHGIRCNAICPGPIETSLLRHLWTSEEARNLRLNRIPLGRFGEANDIAYMALYLSSDESSWTNSMEYNSLKVTVEQGCRGRPSPAGARGVPHRRGLKGQGDRKGRPYHTTKQPVQPVYGRGRACPCPGEAA